LKEIKTMGRSWWMLIVTILIGFAAFAAGPKIWPAGPDVPMPPANLLPGYIVLSGIEALAFGFAVAFALFGWPAIRDLALGAPWLNKWLFVTLCWFTGNWWAHDNLHMHNGLNMHGMIFIEIGFHITMLICGVTLILGFLRLAQRSGGKVDASNEKAAPTAV
jgi:hypothetical protein